jgi:hypothetical protein
MRFAGLAEPVYKETRASVRLILSGAKLPPGQGNGL